VVTKTGKLSFSILESDLLASKIVAASINKSLSIVNSLSGTLKIEFKRLDSISLLTRLSGLVIVLLLVVLDLTPHFSTLSLHHVNFLLNIVNLATQLGVLISLSIVLITETTGLKIFLVQETF